MGKYDFACIPDLICCCWLIFFKWITILIIFQFAHVEVCQSQPESITSSAQKQVQDSGEAQRIEERLPLAYKTREQVGYCGNTDHLQSSFLHGITC